MLILEKQIECPISPLTHLTTKYNCAISPLTHFTSHPSHPSSISSISHTPNSTTLPDSTCNRYHTYCYLAYPIQTLHHQLASPHLLNPSSPHTHISSHPLTSTALPHSTYNRYHTYCYLAYLIQTLHPQLTSPHLLTPHLTLLFLP